MGALTTTGHQSLAVPMLVPAGGTWNDTGQPVTDAMRTRTTRETDGVLVPPPLLVPVEGRDGKQAASASEHLRTQTTRNETELVVAPLPFITSHRDFDGGHDRRLRSMVEAMPTLAASGNHQGMVAPPFIAELRGGGSDHRPLTEPLATFAAGGFHHGLVTPAETMAAWAALYGYDSGELRDHRRSPLPTQTTVQGDGLVTGRDFPAVEDCLFRMLEPHEIHRGMAFTPDYIVLGNKRQKVKQLGNAVTPPVSEILVSALVECITGEQLPRERSAA
jgi:DNA (cytosine-5)-methyltransferase 1